MQLIVIFILTILSNQALAMVSRPEVKCENQAIVRIKSIIDLDPVDHIHARQVVEFEEIEILSGAFPSDTKVEILKFGFFEISKDESYKIGLNKGRLCSLESIK